MIKYGAVSQQTDDTTPAQKVQVRTQSVERECLALYPYGFFANAPKGALAVLLNLNGQEDNKVGMPFIPQEEFEGEEGRFKDLQPGEVLVGNLLTRAFVKFDRDGHIIVEANGDVEVTATGDVSVSAGDVIIQAENAIVDADSVLLGGTGGPAVARVGDSVSNGIITSGSSKVSAT